MCRAYQVGDTPQRDEQDAAEGDQPFALVAEVERGGDARQGGDDRGPARHVPAGVAQGLGQFERGEADEDRGHDHEQRLDHQQADQHGTAEGQADQNRQRQVPTRFGLDLDVGLVDLRPGGLHLGADIRARGVGARLKVGTLQKPATQQRPRPWALRMVRHLDLEELRFLLAQRLVDRVDLRLGGRLELLLGASDLVVSDIRFQRVEVILGLAPDVADRDLGVFALAADDLHEFLAAVLR